MRIPPSIRPFQINAAFNRNILPFKYNNCQFYNLSVIKLSCDWQFLVDNRLLTDLSLESSTNYNWYLSLYHERCWTKTVSCGKSCNSFNDCVSSRSVKMRRGKFVTISYRSRGYPSLTTNLMMAWKTNNRCWKAQTSRNLHLTLLHTGVENFRLTRRTSGAPLFILDLP